MLWASGEWPNAGCDGASRGRWVARRSSTGASGWRPSSPCSQRIGRPCPRSMHSSCTSCTVSQPLIVLLTRRPAEYLSVQPGSSRPLWTEVDDGPRVHVALHADRGRRHHAEEPDLFFPSRRSHGGGRPADRTPATLPRGQGPGWLRAHHLRRVVECPSVVAGRRLEADREP